VSVPAPDRGDLVWVDFDPQAGREQAGRRPALVLSALAYNRRAGLAVMCPITSRRKGYPFEVSLPDGLPLGGVVLVDHVRSLDWRVRRASVEGRVPAAVLGQVGGLLRALLVI
jgi:mRNA interferase MazF